MKISTLLRHAAHYDPSVLGLPPEELEDADDRREALVDVLNRAVDILIESTKAFQDVLSTSDSNGIKQAANAVKRIARRR